MARARGANSSRCAGVARRASGRAAPTSTTHVDRNEIMKICSNQHVLLSFVRRRGEACLGLPLLNPGTREPDVSSRQRAIQPAVYQMSIQYQMLAKARVAGGLRLPPSEGGDFVAQGTRPLIFLRCPLSTLSAPDLAVIRLDSTT